MQKKVSLINTRLLELLHRAPCHENNLYEAAKYSTLLPGKRLRPLLTMLVANDKRAIDPACSLEFIHTYSLIHDDLPCMDDDDIRRGKPTLHKVYNEAHAVLTGDFLNTYAFEVIIQAEGITAEEKIDLLKILTKHCGGKGLIGGQVVDMESQDKSIDWETLKWMHCSKTASLISAALEFGATLAKCPKKETEALAKIGQNIGLAFQIVDDILDETSSTKMLGKPKGSDKKQNKTTSVTLLGIDEARKTAQKLLETSLNLLKPLSVNSEELTALITKFVEREK